MAIILISDCGLFAWIGRTALILISDCGLFAWIGRTALILISDCGLFAWIGRTALILISDCGLFAWIGRTHCFVFDLLYPPYECTYGGYYGLVVVTPHPPPHPQTFHRSHDNLKNPYWIASIFYM